MFNNYDKSKKFKDFIRDYIKDELDSREGQSVYGCDLANIITEEDNVNGTIFVYTNDNKEFIKDNWYEAEETFNYLKEDLDMSINPFKEPCKFVFVMVYKAVEDELANCDLIDQNWNEKIVLNKDVIEEIKNELDGKESNLDHLNISEEKKEEDTKDKSYKEENKKLKIVYKEVGKNPLVMEIEDTLEAKQELVGGLIEVIPYKDDLVLICNEEGKIANLRPNLQFNNDYIAGNCFVIGDDYENSGFKSIKDSQIEDIKKDLENRTINSEETKENKYSVNKYESIIIIKPTLTEDEIKDTINKYKEIFEGFSNKTVEVEDLGKKKLAYEVQGNKEGNYVIFNFYGTKEDINNIERIYRIDNNVMKFLTVKTEENFEIMEDENEEEEEEL